MSVAQADQAIEALEAAGILNSQFNIRNSFAMGSLQENVVEPELRMKS